MTQQQELPEVVYEFVAAVSRAGAFVFRDELLPEHEAPFAVARATDPPLVRVFDVPGSQREVVDHGMRFIDQRLGIQVTRAGSAALALYDLRSSEQQPVKEQPAKRRGRKAATVNQRMAAKLQNDASLIGLTAKQWADQLGCTDTAVKLTSTWKNIIQKSRAMHRVERLERDKRKPR